ncbi:hypothetical protein HDE_01738 [Halotydeus destructor]|nr:hypothetical protein HDE_01738 [Halotydeus destructor]
MTDLTSDEVLNGTYGLSKVFLKQIVYEKKILTKYEERSYISKFFKCSMYTFDKNLDPYSGLTFGIKDDAVNGQLMVYLTSRESYPRGMHMPFMFIQNFLPGHYDWKFNSGKQIKMEAPYPDNCFDYRKEGMDNQDHCLEKCIYEANGKVMPYVFGAISGENYRFGNMTSLYVEKCFRKCSRRSCMDEIFTVDNIWTSLSNLSTAIHLRTTEKALKLTYQPHISFDKYVIYIGSLINTWLGFYLFNVDLAIFRFLQDQGRTNYWQIKLLASLFLSVFCCAGCSFQVYLSATSYFRYEVQSEVYVSPPVPNKLRMPDMSICFNIMDILNSEKLTDISLCSSHALNSSIEYRAQCQHALNGRKFQEIDHLTFQANDLLHQIVLWLPTSQVTISSQNISSISYALGTFFKGRSKCLKIDITRIFSQLEPNYKQLMQLSGSVLMKIMLKETTLVNPKIPVNIYLHNDNTLPFGLAHSSFETKLNEYELMLYSYNALALLPAPYSSKCFDYTSDKLKTLISQQDCIEKCMLEYGGSHTCQSIVSQSMLKYYYLDNHELSRFAVKRCQRRCSRPDCVSVDYRVVSQVMRFMYTGLSFVLSLSSFVVDLSLSPDMKLLEFLLCVASVSALYFNFNLLATFKLLEKKVNTLREKQNGIPRWYFSRRASRCLTVVCLSSGFTLHCFFTLVMYFQRSTVTNGAMTDAKKVKLPGITMCFHFGASLDDTHLTRACSEMKPPYDCPEEMIRYSPLELTGASKNLSQLISTLEVRAADGKSWNSYTGQALADLEKETTETTYMYSYKCFRVTMHSEYVFKKLEYNQEPMEVARVSSVTNAPILFFLHSIENYARHNHLSMMTLLRKGRHRKIAYMPMTRILLPSPYEPTCSNYGDSKINCQEACLDQCRQSMSKKYFNYSSSNVLRFGDDQFKPAKQIAYIDTSQYCKDRCLHPPCRSSSMRVVRLNSGVKTDHRVTVMALRYQGHVEYFPRMELLDLLIYLGGLSGLWFGVAFVSILNHFLKSPLMKKHLARYKLYPVKTKRVKRISVPKVSARTENVYYFADYKVVRVSVVVS